MFQDFVILTLISLFEAILLFSNHTVLCSNRNVCDANFTRWPQTQYWAKRDLSSKQVSSAAVWSLSMASNIRRHVKKKKIYIYGIQYIPPTSSLSHTPTCTPCITQSAGLPFIEEMWWQIRWSASSEMFCLLPLTKHRNFSDCHSAQISSRVSKHVRVETDGTYTCSKHEVSSSIVCVFNCDLWGIN